MTTRSVLLLLLLSSCSGPQQPAAEEQADPPPAEQASSTEDSEAAPDSADETAPAAGAVSEQELEQARQCAGQMDNDCVIRVLEGRAQSALGRALLIDAYMASGRQDETLRDMRVFLEHYPDDERAGTYRQHLEIFAE